MLFSPDFVDRTILNGLDDTSRMDGICDFLWQKFVMKEEKIKE
jgi:hypothetical protein